MLAEIVKEYYSGKAALRAKRIEARKMVLDSRELKKQNRREYLINRKKLRLHGRLEMRKMELQAKTDQQKQKLLYLEKKDTKRREAEEAERERIAAIKEANAVPRRQKFYVIYMVVFVLAMIFGVTTDRFVFRFLREDFTLYYLSIFGGFAAVSFFMHGYELLRSMRRPRNDGQ